ncbi:hypothetical protein EOJ36_06265 [Sandaracinomonas limnophila]|uniref:Uncharacterized protein n=1 Tax=Sandaracinomonas limnophila TaxID=1862386 RepID=A0A437PQT0_9BACT|nr:hypothetical protein [Sandaracinomonas limnophila]RVU24612.1 hypothetical protein EOJ36_06265 [Sandaracinomonas limnophila]
MENYIKHLTDDLKAAQRLGKQNIRQSFTSFEDYIDDIETYTCNYKNMFIFELIGIGNEWFPESNLLSESQMKVINNAFEKCLYSWNIILDIPKSFPTDKKYKLIVSTLGMRVNILQFGFLHLDFCEQDVENCPLGPTHCSCQHFFNDENYIFSSLGDDDLD